MRGREQKNLFVIIICILFFSSFRIASAGKEIYRLKPLFDMEAGKEPGQFDLYFMPQPFPPGPGEKYTLYPGRPWIKIDNSGNFYFMNKWNDVVKLNTRGEVVKQIHGADGFTRPGRIEIDRWDNLYVLFRNETNIAEEFKYQTAKFDKDGNLLYWIKDAKTGEPFECVFMLVSINGTAWMRICTGGGTQYFDKDGHYLGNVDFPTEAVEGADSNLYFIDNKVQKCAVYDGRLRTLRGTKPLIEKAIKKEGFLAFVGFDINNNIYFDLRRGYKEIELPAFKLAVTNLSVTKKMIRYDFSNDTYDTLICKPLIERESEYVASGIHKNYNGEIFEIRLFFNEPNKITPDDHVRVYRWVEAEE